MNSVAEHTTICPNDKTEQCALFTIDDTTQRFVLQGVATKGKQHTFSCWAKSDAAGSVVVAGVVFATAAEWERFSVTFTPTTENVALTFGMAGTYYIYHAQLEIGNKATDWTPAPEDVDESITSVHNDVRESMVMQETSLIANCHEILASALETYVETGSFEEFKATLKAELEIFSEGIVGRVTATEESIKNVDGDLQAKYNTITKYFSFDLNGFTIGMVDNPNKVVIDHDEISILVNGMPVQEFKADGTALIPVLKITTAFDLLGMVITEDETHINCEYVQGV